MAHSVNPNKLIEALISAVTSSCGGSPVVVRGVVEDTVHAHVVKDGPRPAEAKVTQAPLLVITQEIAEQLRSGATIDVEGTRIALAPSLLAPRAEDRVPQQAEALSASVAAEEPSNANAAVPTTATSEKNKTAKK